MGSLPNAKRGKTGNARPMEPDRETVRVVLKISRARDPIEGELLEPRESAALFSGWISLASLIEASRDGVGSEGSGSEGSEGSESPGGG